MKRNKLFALLVSAAPLFAAELEEVPSTRAKLTGTTHVLVTSRVDANDPSVAPNQVLKHENSFRAEYGPYSASIGFSSFIPMAGPNPGTKSVTLEKKLVSAEWENWDVKLGDTYQELGRGIALSLYRDDVFGVDNTLEGGSLRFHPQGLTLGIFGGRVNAVRNPVAINPQENPLKDRTVWITGGAASVRVINDLKVGGHYFGTYNQPAGAPGFDKAWQTLGASITADNIFDAVDANLEANTFFGQFSVLGKAKDIPQGYGTYASLSYAPESWKFRLEAKHYQDYAFEFHRPPALEEDVVETTNNENVSGARLYGEKKLEGTRTTLFSSYYTGYDRPLGSTIHHGVAGSRFQFLANTDWELKAGYRWMPDHNNLVHFGLKSKIKTFKGQFLEIGARKQKANLKLNVIPYEEDRNFFDVGYNFNELLSAQLGYEFVPSNDPSVGQHFINIGGRMTWGIVTARAMVGSTSGGTQCSGGVCRVVPPFTGAMIDTIFTF